MEDCLSLGYSLSLKSKPLQKNVQTLPQVSCIHSSELSTADTQHQHASFKHALPQRRFLTLSPGRFMFSESWPND